MNKIQIFATDIKGERIEIDDLYWFEENFVHDFNDDRYKFDIFINNSEDLTMFSFRIGSQNELDKNS